MKIIRFFIILGLAVLIFFPVSNLLGFNGENDPISVVPGSAQDFAGVSKILQDKCVDCHSPGMTRKPIYADLPIARQLMQHDIEAASTRFYLSREVYSGADKFTPVMLNRLEHAIRSDSMPPALYLSMHWTGALNNKEKQDILNWIRNERARQPGLNGIAAEFIAEPVQPLPLTVSLNPEKVALGKSLFLDTRLSGDNTIACASCHDLTKGGTDQAQVATGIQGHQGPINSPTVYNAVYNLAQFWDGRAEDLQAQAEGPVANPMEMGEHWDNVVRKLKQVSQYNDAFARLYPESGLTKASVTDAIAVFEKSLITPNSRFDQYLKGDTEILSQEEKAGYALFKTSHCTSCHFGPVLGGMSYEKMGRSKDYFKLRGGKLTKADYGRYNVTNNESERFFFKVPVLRNIELTFPYFHDGSVNELTEAVRIMGLVQLGIHFKEDEIQKITAFLKTLTGEYHGVNLTKLQTGQFDLDMNP